MSALGATELFQDERNHGKDMVLQTCPLSFVKEVKRKMGAAEFFASESLGFLFRDGPDRDVRGLVSNVIRVRRNKQNRKHKIGESK